MTFGELLAKCVVVGINEPECTCLFTAPRLTPSPSQRIGSGTWQRVHVSAAYRTPVLMYGRCPVHFDDPIGVRVEVEPAATFEYDLTTDELVPV